MNNSAKHTDRASSLRRLVLAMAMGFGICPALADMAAPETNPTPWTGGSGTSSNNGSGGGGGNQNTDGATWSGSIPSAGGGSTITPTSPSRTALPDTDPIIPVGSLSAFPTIVQAGTHPTLTWSIQYPETVRDLIAIHEGGDISTLRDVTMQVRVLGASFQAGFNRWGKPIWLWLRGDVRTTGTGNFVRIFEGSQRNVNPSRIYYHEDLKQGDVVQFRARGFTGATWLPFRATGGNEPRVSVLVNGDRPPDYAAAYGQENIASFLRPYLDSAGFIRIGPKDVIVLFELANVEPGSPFFDMQDLVLLATFGYARGNNGHGNNLDGVDSSNPGNGGPAYDPSGDFDDEMK